MLKVIDNVTFSWAKSIIMDDQRVATVHQIGVKTATAALHPDQAKFLGDPGICPNCHSRDMHIYESSQRVECVVCGIMGELVIQDNKIKFEFDPEQYQKAHNTIPGKFKHVEDIGKLERRFAAERETAEYRARIAKYRSFIQPSTPPKKQ